MSLKGENASPQFQHRESAPASWQSNQSIQRLYHLDKYAVRLCFGFDPDSAASTRAASSTVCTPDELNWEPGGITFLGLFCDGCAI